MRVTVWGRFFFFFFEAGGGGGEREKEGKKENTRGKRKKKEKERKKKPTHDVGIVQQLPDPRQPFVSFDPDERAEPVGVAHARGEPDPVPGRARFLGTVFFVSQGGEERRLAGAAGDVSAEGADRSLHCRGDGAEVVVALSASARRDALDGEGVDVVGRRGAEE